MAQMTGRRVITASGRLTAIALSLQFTCPAALSLQPVVGRALQQGPCTGACPVNIQGMNYPISITWDTFGHIFVAEKDGLVKATTSWVSTPTTITLDLTSEVTYNGDHGLTSILWSNGYLFATYMKQNAEWGANGCTDSGQNPGGRPWPTILGCNIYGRVSRWPINALGVITGPEQVLIDTQLTDAHGRNGCVQFSTHSTPASIIASGDGGFYVSFGDGAAFTMPDYGQLGTSITPPVSNQGGCKDNSPYLGAFRAQDPARFNGKIIRLFETVAGSGIFDYTIVSTGHRNPFRLSLFNGLLLESETGWYTYEEVNLIEPGKNYGEAGEWGSQRECRGTGFITHGRHHTFEYHHCYQAVRTSDQPRVSLYVICYMMSATLTSLCYRSASR